MSCMSEDRVPIEAWVAPYLEPELNGCSRVKDMPASEVRAALALDPTPDQGPTNGVSGPAMVAAVALACHQDSTLSGVLIGQAHPDAQLQLDTVTIPGGLSIQQVFSGLTSAIPPPQPCCLLDASLLRQL